MGGNLSTRFPAIYIYLYFHTFIKYNIMVIYRVDYEQKRINEQITVPKHTWKVKANATPMVQMMEKKIQK